MPERRRGSEMPSLFDLPFEEPPEPQDPPARPARDRPYTVSGLTAVLRDAIEQRFADVWVEGEASNCRPYGGHLYFTLKDAGAQLRAVAFSSALRRLKFRPCDGQQLVARGRLTVYDRRGEYQLVCEQLEPKGIGALQVAFEALKRKLEAEGLFDDGRKRALPLLPRRIGVVTSLDGAAVRDILKVLLRRVPNASVVLRDTRVQGDGAGDDIRRALRRIVRVPGVDVVILARGGGSIEDLWAFNDEALARDIAACPVPVISGVGHQTDFTIADFVADVRAATPSNAAELVVAARAEFVSRLDALRRRAVLALRRRVDRGRQHTHALQTRSALARVPLDVANARREFQDMAARARRAIVAACARRGRQRESLAGRLDVAAPRRRLGAIATRLARVDAHLGSVVAARLAGERSRLAQHAGQLDALSPLAVLGRGYAVCWNEDRTAVLRRADATLRGREVHVRLAAGTLDCVVTNTSADDSGPQNTDGHDAHS